MKEGSILLVAILSIGIFTRNKVLATAAAVVLGLGLAPFKSVLLFFCYHGVFLGLLFLTIAVLAPLMAGQFGLADIIATLFSPVGLVAIVGGLFSSIMNRKGVHLLQWEPSLATGVILGSLISMAFFGGIPVGPVMAAGLASVLIDILRALNII